MDIIGIYHPTRKIRAAERYADITPEERVRRRERGWGNEAMVNFSDYSS